MRDLLAIRDLRVAVAKLLSDADISGVGKNVFTCRAENAWPEEGFFICVYTPASAFNDQRTSPKFYKVETTVYVDVVSNGNNENTNDRLDEIANQVFKILQPVWDAKGEFSGVVKRFVLTNAESTISEQGERSRGVERLTFKAEYPITQPTEGPGAEFLKAKNDANIGAGEGNRMTFETTMRQ